MTTPDIGDSRKSGEPSDDDIVNTWIFRPDLHGGDLMPQLIDFARTLLARFGTRPAAEEGDYERDVRKALAAKDKWAEFIPELRGGVSAENAIEILGFMIAGEKEPSQSGSAGGAEDSALISRYTTALLDWGRDGGPYAPVEATRKELRAALSRQAPAAPAEAKLRSLLQNWLDSFAADIEGGEADELVKASREALFTPPTPEAEPVQQDTGRTDGKHWLDGFAGATVGWSDDQMIRFAGTILLGRDNADSIEQRLATFVKHEKLRGIPTPPAEKQAAPSGEDQ